LKLEISSSEAHLSPNCMGSSILQAETANAAAAMAIDNVDRFNLFVIVKYSDVLVRIRRTELLKYMLKCLIYI